MQILMMMMMSSFLYLALADQSLECSNDYYNTFTCVWNSSTLSVRPESRCFLRVTVNKGMLNPTLEAQMTADPTQPHIRTGIVVFKSKYGIIRALNMLYEEVRCENYTQPLLKIPGHMALYSVVKVAPPWSVAVHRLNVTWSFSSSKVLSSVFEVQCRSAAQSWTDVSVRETSESHLELSEDDLLVQHQFVIRVRVKRIDLENAVWSDWSEEHSWTSEVGRTPPTPTAPGVSVILGLDWSVAGFILTALTVGVSVCVILIRCHRNKQLHSFYIPDPSKFFGDLNSHHGGNFTSWLGPILSRESFIKVNTEYVSPVEVLKLQVASESQSTHRHCGGQQDGWDGTNKSSNFSNSTYFLSQSSKGPSDTLEPCSPHSSYGPAGGISGPEAVLQSAADDTHCAEEKDGATELEFSPKTLEKLRLDTQSPDSGFAGGAEDSMEEAELSSPLTLNLPAHLPAHLPAPQPVMHPLLGFKHTAGLSLIPGLIDLDLQSSCGMIEPSSGDYMPVKNVQS